MNSFFLLAFLTRSRHSILIIPVKVLVCKLATIRTVDSFLGKVVVSTNTKKRLYNIVGFLCLVVNKVYSSRINR